MAEERFRFSQFVMVSVKQQLTNLVNIWSRGKVSLFRTSINGVGQCLHEDFCFCVGWFAIVICCLMDVGHVSHAIYLWLTDDFVWQCQAEVV